jgi:hypothetical protein
MECIVVRKTDDGCLGLQFAHGEMGTVQESIVSRSPVLSNLVASAQKDEFVTIAVPAGYMRAWLEVVAPQLDPSRLHDFMSLIISIKVRLSSPRFEAGGWDDASASHVASSEGLHMDSGPKECIREYKLFSRTLQRLCKEKVEVARVAR